MSDVKKIHATIDGKQVEVDPGTTIIKAAETVDIKIPTLCYLKDLMTPEASCRMCMVEIVGMPKLVTACSFPIAEGNEILTKSPRVVEARRGILDLLLSNHPNDCFACPGNGDCEFQSLCYEYGVKETTYPGEMEEKPIDDSNPYFTYNPNLCILCHRCVNTCEHLVGRAAIGLSQRGFKSRVSAAPFQDKWINNMECEFCGNCIQACPVGALRPKNRENLKYRPWEVKKVASTCYNCKKGCKRYLLVKNGKLVDVVSDPESFNKGRLCNKGRFEFYDVEKPGQIAILEAKDIERAREVLKEQLGLK
jgi:formate dehydrogenase major subunit